MLGNYKQIVFVQQFLSSFSRWNSDSSCTNVSHISLAFALVVVCTASQVTLSVCCQVCLSLLDGTSYSLAGLVWAYHPKPKAQHACREYMYMHFKSARVNISFEFSILNFSIQISTAPFSCCTISAAFHHFRFCFNVVFFWLSFIAICEAFGWWAGGIKRA